MTIDWTDSDDWEFAESTLSDSGVGENIKDGSDSWLLSETATVASTTGLAAICLPLTVQVAPIVYTVAMCVDPGDDAEQNPGTPGFDWPITEMWWPVTEEVPPLLFKLLSGAGNPGRPGGYTEPLEIYDNVAEANAAVLLDISRADGRFVQQIEMTVTDVATAEVMLPSTVTIAEGDYTARFTVAWSYQTVSVPTVPITIHARAPFDG